MSTTRRAAATALVTILAVTGLAPAQAATKTTAVVVAGRPKAAPTPDVARGLIVRTASGTASGTVLSAAGEALGDQAEVTGGDRLVAQISTIDFDRVVDASVAVKVAAQVEQRADVVWAIPNRLRRIDGRIPVSTDDPLLGQQRNLWDPSSGRSGGFSIKAPALWRATRGVASTVVAVIDTGVVDHPDLAGKLVPGYDFISSPARARDGDGRDGDPTDSGDWNGAGQCPYPGATTSSWHGTFVAGQIAAAADNGIGIAGVAPGVMVQPVRALGRCGGWDSDILDAMTWASGGTVRGVPANATPAAVVNLSLGGTARSSSDRAAACRVYNAVAKRGQARGSLFVAAAGNEGGNANRAVPASCSEFVSVGATSRKGFSSVFSNVGSTVDLSAPGGDTLVEGRNDSIVSLGNSGRTRAGKPGYVRYEGTSMAAPQVAGAAALLYGLGYTTPASLRSALLASVTPFRGRSSKYAHQRVRIDKKTYSADLNCTARHRHWCGRGLLDLSRVQAPASAPSIGGTVAVGSALTATSGQWVRTPRAITYTWRADGVVVGSGALYRPTAGDVGRHLTVTVAPASGVYARLAKTSAPLPPVPTP